MWRRLISIFISASFVLLGASALTAGARADAPGPPTGTLRHGVTEQLDFTHRQQQIVLQVYAKDGERMSLDSGDQTGLLYDVYRPAADGGGQVESGASASDTGLTVDATGWFTIVFYVSGGATGSFPVTGDVSMPIAAGTVHGGATVTGTTSHRGQALMYTFQGEAGQRPTVLITADSLIHQDAPLTGEVEFAQILFVGPDGVQQPIPPSYTNGGNVVGSFYGQSVNSYAEGQVLDQTGEWTLIIEPVADSFGSLSMTFHLAKDQHGGRITAHQPTAVSVPKPGVNVTRSVHLHAGQKVTATVTDVAFSQPDGLPGSAVGPFVDIHLFGPDGYETAGTRIGASEQTPFGLYWPAVPVTGEYTLQVDGESDTVGSLTVRTDPFSDRYETTTIGTENAVTALEPGQATFLSFSAAQGQHLSVTVADTCWTEYHDTHCLASHSTVALQLIAPDGSVRHIGVGSHDHTVHVRGALAASGTYQLVVQPSSGFTGSGVYTVTATG